MKTRSGREYSPLEDDKRPKLNNSQKRRQRRGKAKLAKDNKSDVTTEVCEAVESSIVSTNEIIQNPSASNTLPTYDELVELHKKGKEKELNKHGKTDIMDLNFPRNVQLKLLDTIIFHLNRDFKLQSKNQDDLAKEKRDILAGAKFYVSMEIAGSYCFPYNLFVSVERSEVHNNIKSALQSFDAESTNKALLAFSHYFTANNLPADETMPVIKYTVEEIAKAIPQPKVAEIKEEEKQQLGKRRFNLFGSSKKTDQPAQVMDKPEESVSHHVVSRPN